MVTAFLHERVHHLSFPLNEVAVVLGVSFHARGGSASGTFYLPYKNVEGWAWESYWLIGGLFSWVAAPRHSFKTVL